MLKNLSSKANIRQFAFASVAFLLFWAQVRLTFFGREQFEPKTNATLLFTVSIGLSLFAFYLFSKDKNADFGKKPTAENALLWSLVGILSILAWSGALYKLFFFNSEWDSHSDVLRQLDTQALRFERGEFPYQNVHLPTHDPFPVYMPAHWFPLIFPHRFHIDIRWLGVGVLAAAVGLFGFWLSQLQRLPMMVKIMAIALPSVVIWQFLTAFYRISEYCLPFTLETLIAAYYLILLVGLLLDNVFIIAFGLILCVLSRYTLVFWLPIFGFIFWKTHSVRQNIGLWAAAILSVLGFYVLPFLLKDPTIFAKTFAYYNGATLGEWRGYGEPPVSYSFANGTYFAQIFRENLSGELTEKIAKMRLVQVGLLLLTNAALFFFWKKNRSTVGNGGVFNAVSLHLILTIFYAFSPLTFRYYLLTTLILSGVLVAICFNYAFSKKRITV